MPTELTDKHPSKPGSSRKSQSSSRKSRHAPSQPVESRPAPPQPVEEPHRTVTPEHAQEDLNESFLAAGEYFYCLIITIRHAPYMSHSQNYLFLERNISVYGSPSFTARANDLKLIGM